MGNLNDGLFLVKCRDDGRYYIEKRLMPRDIMNGHALYEYQALKHVIKHPNILSVVACDLDKRRAYGSIWMEYCSLGALDMVIARYRERRAYIPEPFIWSVFGAISVALCYLYTGVDVELEVGNRQTIPPVRGSSSWDKVYHRDIKPGNIFLTEYSTSGEVYPKPILGDFGCAALQSDINRGRRGIAASRFSPAFEPPENRSGTGAYKATSDIYQLGLVIHCMARNLVVPDQNARGDRPVGGPYTSELNYLVRKCIDYDYSRRPHPSELPHLIDVASQRADSQIRRSLAPLPRWALP